METITIHRKKESNNILYFLNGEEIARSINVNKTEILNPAQSPEYKAYFVTENTKCGNFVGLDSVAAYLEHRIYQHFGTMCISCKIIDMV